MSHPARTIPQTWLPLTVLTFSAAMWGVTWWPLKQFGTAGLSGPLISLASYGLVGLLGLPLLLRERHLWQGQISLLLLLALLGGWANASFVRALTTGDVVRVMLLFYLAPVWSVIGGRLFLQERVTRRRMLAVFISIFGAFLVIGGAAAFTAPLSVADLLALSAGLAFAGNNLVTRAAQAIPMISKTVAVFIGCGVISALMVWQQSAAQPDWSPNLLIALTAFGFGWLILATFTTQYGVTHLETGRAGIILIVELLAAVISAVIVGGEQLLPREWMGGTLIASAAVIEATASADESHKENREYR
ncbi:multidrug DMT transporter permease [Sulfuriferula sp. AH1]|uniref:DMT family transporter n=1 Tax=Sulfuriferula sp. AH1 TaxID=1985873 RepID=UPI000B3B53BE|nr:DMT family transporter [Sulfuriferula sp. AH1]ARU31390.1 multidrug DMT transporter permease [Sulfuriferula sp. AH1]